VVAECVETCLVEAVEAAIIPEESVTRGFLSECQKIEKICMLETDYPKLLDSSREASSRNSNRSIPVQIALLKKVGRVGYYIGSESIS